MNRFVDFDIIKKRRRSLLPWWIKVFCGIFLFTGIVAVIHILLSLFGINFPFQFYGIDGAEGDLWKTIIVYIIFLLHGFTAYSLWFEKVYAVHIGIIDAILGIILCSIMMVNGLLNGNVTFRFEMILLIIFLVKLIRIKTHWNKLN